MPFGICLAATKDSAFSLGVLLLNIMDKMQKDVDAFYIVNDGFCMKDKELMKAIVQDKKITFIDFSIEDFTQNIALFAKTSVKLSQSQFLQRYTHMAFARFEALKFLHECEKILYLDFDMLLLKGLGHLKNTQCNLALFKGSATLKEGLGEGACPKHLEDKRNFASGIILFDKSVNGLNPLYDFIYEFLAKHYESVFKEAKLLDQALLSLYIYENKLDIYELSDAYYGITSWIKSKDAYIIHAFGMNNRFWNNKLVALCYPTWDYYYAKWLELGGSAYMGARDMNFKEVPSFGSGALYQYFERILLAQEILALNLNVSLILEPDFHRYLKFYFANLSKDIYLIVSSKSKFTYKLEFVYKGKIEELNIKREHLSKELSNFLEHMKQKYLKN